MDRHLENPEANGLPAGVGEEQLLAAVKDSGYPLQAIVAQQLAKHFKVIEEWGYVDRETKEPRSLDVSAQKRMASSERLDVGLTLLVECKRADLPFVFFPPVESLVPSDFPRVCGFPFEGFVILPRSGGALQDVTPARFFCVRDFPFVSPGPTIATAFARSERKGKRVELSGTVPFNSLILPLTSAMDHFLNFFSAVGQQQRYSPQIVVGIAALDAPMVVARGTLEQPQLTLTPWLRVVHQEVLRERNSWRRRHNVVDIVHRNYLVSFIDNHVLPFAQALADRMLEKEALVLSRRAVVPGSDAWGWGDLEPWQ